MKTKSQLIITLFTLLMTFSQVEAQFWKKLKEKVDKVSLKSLSKPPITTSFEDVDKTKYIENSVGDGENFLDLYEQEYVEGCFKLTPGFYEATVASFCIKAGTYMPTSGAGRFYAPLEGPKKEIVETIALAFQDEKKITQREAQLLLWAIIAKTDFQKMSGNVKKTALKVLSTEQILELSKGAITRLGKKQLNKLIGKSSTLSTILEAENKMREMYYGGLSTYADFEKVAFLAGIEPTLSGFESGRWTKHPEGYFIRYYANGYTSVRIQIYVPDSLEEICFNAIGDVAVPANTSSQRLLLTNLSYKKFKSE